MIKKIITYICIMCACLFSAEYDVGDTVDLDDQDQRFTVCNGEHFNNELEMFFLTNNNS